MEHGGDQFQIGEHVLINVPGYRLWPAKITSIETPNTEYGVYFFGTKEPSFCKAEEILPYHEHKDGMKRDFGGKYYKEGIKELEEDMTNKPGPSNEQKGLKGKSRASADVTAAKQVSAKKKVTTKAVDKGEKRKATTSKDSSEDEYSDGEYSKENSSDDDISGMEYLSDDDEVMECSPEEESQVTTSKSGRIIKKAKKFNI